MNQRERETFLAARRIDFDLGRVHLHTSGVFLALSNIFKKHPDAEIQTSPKGLRFDEVFYGGGNDFMQLRVDWPGGVVLVHYYFKNAIDPARISIRGIREGGAPGYRKVIELPDKPVVTKKVAQKVAKSMSRAEKVAFGRAS